MKQHLKQLLPLSAVILLCASCNKSEELPTPTQGQIVTTTLSTDADDSQSRVSVTADKSAWYVQWNKGDIIGAWSPETSLFPLAMTDMDTATTATFSGENNSGAEFTDDEGCYIYPYSEGATSDGKLLLDLSNQTCDMSTPDYYLADNSYIVSTIGNKRLNNLTSMFELQLKFEYGTVPDSGNSEFYKIVFKGDKLRTKGQYDLSTGTIAYDEPTSGTADSIVVNIVNSTLIKQKDTYSHIVRFTTLPFMLLEDDAMDIDLYVHHKGKDERIVYRLGIKAEKTEHIVAGYYNTIKKKIKLADCPTWVDDKYVAPSVDDTKYSGGEGTAQNPYLLATAADLSTLSTDSAAGEFYKLSSDIETTSQIATLNGTFDGNFKTITHSGSNTALFAEIAAGATVKNLKLLHNHTMLKTSGCLTISNKGIIDNCYILPCDITSKYTATAAGFCKDNTGLISNSVNAINISTSKPTIAGFVATNYELASNGYIVNCVNLGNLTSTNGNVGGFIGMHTSGEEIYLYNCYSAGDMSGKSDVGEIAGKSTKNSGEFIYSLGRYTKTITGETKVTDLVSVNFIETLNGNLSALTEKIPSEYSNIEFNEWIANENGFPIPYVEKSASVGGGEIPSTSLNWADEASLNYGGGLGTATSPYIITSAYELARLIESGSSEEYYKLMEDIDLTSGNWSVVESAISTNFNYNGKTISGIHTTTENLGSIFAE